MSQHRWRVYIDPFDKNGIYSGYQEVTDWVDMQSLSQIAQDLDNRDYSLGVYRNNSFQVTFRNDTGKFSDVGSPQTIFGYTRGNSKLKITWQAERNGLVAGFFRAGFATLSVEQTVFEGLLNDDSLAMDLDTQKLSFQVLGLESTFDQAIVPFSSIANGQLLSAIMYTLLNQTAITDVLTVALANIVPGTDLAIDDISPLENQTVKDALDDLLLLSNSVLYISSGTVYISARNPSATVKFSFYGQGSTDGVENIQNIKNIKSGLSRTFNYVSWDPSQVYSQDAFSVAKYGARTMTFDQKHFTDATKQQTILDNIRTEFANPKQEFELYTPIDVNTIALSLLDKISIDYPTVYVASDNPLPICGEAICGQAVTPTALWSFTVAPTDYYKITGRTVDIRNGLMRFKMRAV